ncbi:IS110 family transposase [Arthrobacter sp.]|uniref:IS110 family transposase n=1 Tax=Arthrobacter sp. TaxID=1667 RepID=UPI00258612E1|nr:IS110 family transposase [Arthrobacter sp.]
MATSSSLDRLGVGIDTARYGHRVSFLRPDRQPAATPLTVLENQASYDKLRQRLEQLHRQHPQAQFHVRIDAAGQYATNLEAFLRGLDLPMTISIGEPKRNKDYQKAHFPKRTSDDTESQAMARFAVVELPPPTPAPVPEFVLLREVAGRLQAQVKQTTQAANRLHNLLARVFPELATLIHDLSAGWVLTLLDQYPSAERIAQARLSSLQKIPYLPADLAETLHQAAQHSVGSLRGSVAETLVRDLVAQLRHAEQAEQNMRELLHQAYAALPAGGHSQLVTIPGIGAATAAVLAAKIIAINRFATPEQLVAYFGVFPDEHTSGVDPAGKPLPAGTLHMSPKGNDLVRHYLWNAARSAITCNPAIRALYRRLRAKGKRGDVAVGHCMRKLLHLVYALWKTNRPFDPQHFAWEPPQSDTEVSIPAPEPQPTPPADTETTVGHTREIPAQSVVTTVPASVAPPAPPVNPPAAPTAPAALPTRPRLDYAFLRQQVTLEQVLRHLGLFEQLRGSGVQRRGPCPLHAHPTGRAPTFSVHLGKNVFQCFHADCAAHGNVLDFWAALHRLPLYEAALDLAATFHLPRNREEEPVK